METLSRVMGELAKTNGDLLRTLRSGMESELLLRLLEISGDIGRAEWGLAKLLMADKKKSVELLEATRWK